MFIVHTALDKNCPRDVKCVRVCESDNKNKTELKTVLKHRWPALQLDLTDMINCILVLRDGATQVLTVQTRLH